MPMKANNCNYFEVNVGQLTSDFVSKQSVAYISELNLESNKLLSYNKYELKLVT